MNALTIYLWGISEGVPVILFAIGAISATCGGLGAFGFTMAIADSRGARNAEERATYSQIRSSFTRVLFAGLATLILSSLIPDRTTIAAMVILPGVAESEAIRQDMPELWDMAVQRLKDELTPTEK